MGKQPKKNFALRELERQLTKALQKGNDQLVSDLYIDIAEEYRRNRYLSNSIEAYKNSLNFAEKCSGTENAAFCHRAIAEMSIDSSIGDDQEALLHGREYFRLAQKSGEVHLVQLAYHVYGWLQFQVYLNSGAKNKKLLTESRDWCENGLKYLDRNAVVIDSDAKAIRIGQDSRARKARLRQVLSQIYDKLGDSVTALSHHNAAFAYAVKELDFDLQYRCLLSKLNFIGDQRIKTAVDLVHVASNLGAKEHVDAKFILAQEKIRAGDLEGAKWDMISMLSGKDMNFLDKDEHGYFQQCLATVYKTLERLRTVSTLSIFNRMKTFERIADEFIDLDFRETSLVFYEKMLCFTEDTSDRIKGLVSVAETARELEDYQKAYDCYAEIEALESNLQLEDKKRGETALCLLSVAVKNDTLPVSQIRSCFGKAERLVETNRQKRILYETYLEYLKGAICAENEIEEIKTKLEQVACSRDSSNSESACEEIVDDWSDQFSDMSVSQVLVSCEVEASRRSMEERIQLEKDKKINLYGETRMHEAARGNDLSYIKLLINAGYNINAQDEGGWTPLHEAIGALKLDNVRLLVQAGANLDIKSKEGTLSAEGERTDSGGLTPLMEACDRGCTSIVKLLLEHGADVTLRNRDNWTALDFLRNAVHMELVEEEDIPVANKLISLLETKLRKSHAPISDFPPPKRLLKQVSLNGTPGKVGDGTYKSSTGKKELSEYKKIMRDFGKGETHERRCLVDDDLDIGVSVKGAWDDDDRSVVLDEDENVQRLANFTPKRKRAKLNVEKNVKKRVDEAKGIGEDSNLFDDGCVTNINLKGNDGDLLVSQTLAKSSSIEVISKNMVSTQGTRQESLSSVPPNASSQDWLFVKIIFKNSDGSKLKVKGIPFTRYATIAEVRDRCLKEVCGDGESTSLCIRLEDCELSDETPISLVLDSANNSLECTVGEISKLSPAQTYLKSNAGCKSDILRALNESENGTLNLSNCSIQKDASALTKTLSAFLVNSLNELNLSGNVLEIEFFQPISFLARSLDVLKLRCCAIDNRGMDRLLGNRTICSRLSYLDISFNNLSSFPATSSLLSFLILCPNLKELYLSACDLNDVLIQSLCETLKGLTQLESLDVSCNSSITSAVVTGVASTCLHLTSLDISNTDFHDFDVEVAEFNHHLKQLLVVGCNISTTNFPKLLGSSNSFSFVDLSLTNITSEGLETLVRQKGTKLPVVTLKLYDCTKLEATHLSGILHSLFTTETAVRFHCPASFRSDVLRSLPSSYEFCFK